MFTRLKKKLVGDASDIITSPSGSIGSQPALTKVTAGKAVGKKRAGKAEPEVVALPFGSLPGDFGIQPLPTKEISQKTKAATKRRRIVTGDGTKKKAKSVGTKIEHEDASKMKGKNHKK